MEDLEHLSAKAYHDFELVKRAMEGDQKAYSELMKRYYDSIYFMMLKMVKSKDDADDLTMEAFGKAFKGLAHYTPDYAFSTWLFKIATNNCIDHMRKQKIKPISIDKTYENDEGDEMSMEVKSQYLDPEEKYIKKQKIKIMHDIVEKLKPRYRTLVELRYFKEWSYEEIAEHLDMPIGTVKGQLFRAKEIMLHILKNSKDKI
ncbi:MAG TPA: sigma-70 family RNA polymerase sigma factor [Bacteroidia bacterium]|jgi:RNA polymerase sigma factor (sigma-70 family)|nr:sigma-70 family RNA polymerase sigma factor [Bacteroidia bacterium]